MNMENKARPLSREERDNKRMKIDPEKFHEHINTLLPKENKVVEKVIKGKK